MLILALDTALKSCAVAIVDGETILADFHERLEKGHAERLAPMAIEAMAAAGIVVADLDRVGVVIGPGAFAGVRVGVAFARGLALGTRLDAVGVTSLAALAGAVEGGAGALTAPVIDARRGQVYAALYGADLSVRIPPFVAAPDAARARLAAASGGAPVGLTGDGAALILGQEQFFMAGDGVDIDAKIVARLAAAGPAPSQPPAPLYLRPPDARPGAPSPFAGLLASPPA
jgi:tRNA threonylcarbamoyladenosine biosynthesis protein TsaB